MSATAEASAPALGADQKKGAGAAQSQYMSFVIEGSTYAIPLTDVAEITPYVELNHMPHMPSDVVGLLDLRGSVLPVISLRTRMGLPNKKSHAGDTIILLGTQQGSRIGILVDQVESVITASEEQHAHLSLMLEGKTGKWVRAILLLNDKVTLVLEPDALINIAPLELAGKEKVNVHFNDIELRLDKGLRDLIALANYKGGEPIVPQIQNVIQHNESEVLRVMERIEAMLTSTDAAFTGLSRFKQEAAMCGLQVFDGGLAKLDKITQDLQLNIFDILNELQFQDIVRQKLERVLRHILGMQEVIAVGFKNAAM